MSLLPRDLPGRLANDGYTGSGHEAEAPGLQMRVLSASKARRYCPGENEVCIALRSHGTLPVPLQGGWVAILHVECDDTGPFAAAASEARSLSQDDARTILRFVEGHRHRRRLVIHCVAGVSRSRSLAAALATIYALPYRWTAFNRDVVSALHAAAATVMVSQIFRESPGRRLP